MTNEEATKMYKELMDFVGEHKDFMERIRSDSLALGKFCVEYDPEKKTDWECIGCPFDRSTDTESNVCILNLPFDYELGDSSSWIQAAFEKERMKHKN